MNMMMCSRCGKRPAVVFVSQTNDVKNTKGLCMVCAKELGIQPVNDLMEKMGITDEQLEAMSEEMNGLMATLENAQNNNGEDEDGFTPGGAATFRLMNCSAEQLAMPMNLPPRPKLDG